MALGGVAPGWHVRGSWGRGSYRRSSWPACLAQAGARRWDWRLERHLGLGRVSVGIEEKTENDSVVSLCGGSPHNFDQKLTEAHFPPLSSFLCTMGI
jgi:hypothetical protein